MNTLATAQKPAITEADFEKFAEFFYRTEGSDYNFDPEFSHDSLLARARLRLKKPRAFSPRK